MYSAKIIAEGYQTLVGKLPDRFKWTIHHVIIHPLTELLYQLDAGDIGMDIHDGSIPDHYVGSEEHLRKDPAESVGFVSKICVTFRCSQCGAEGQHSGSWGEHHTLPVGWVVRDVVPSYVLRRQTDHVFSCSPECSELLDEKYPPPARPIWFGAP